MTEVRAKEEELRLKNEATQHLELELSRLKEECNTYKGRCNNLQRDLQVS
jgi:cell shape-determining protein MreC